MNTDDVCIKSQGNQLRFLRPIIECAIKILLECYGGYKNIPDTCLPNSSKEISLTSCLNTAAYLLRNQQAYKYFPAAEVPVTRTSKKSTGRLDLALFSKNRVALIECKHARSEVGSSLSQLVKRYREAKEQLLDIKSLAGMQSFEYDNDDFVICEKIPFVSATLIMPLDLADELDISQLRSDFWHHFEKVQSVFDSHLVAGVFLGQHHINRRIDRQSGLSKYVSIGQLFVLGKA